LARAGRAAVEAVATAMVMVMVKEGGGAGIHRRRRRRRRKRGRRGRAGRKRIWGGSAALAFRVSGRGKGWAKAVGQIDTRG
jgi:hypothetical protein